VYRPHPQIPLKNTQTIHAVCSVWDKGYRYGFNGMEKDNEINVNGGSYDFGARIYDSRLGRWLSLDPVRNTSWSSYASFKNSPVVIIDPNGETDFYNNSGNWIGTDGDINTNGEIKIITNEKLIKQIIKTSKKGQDFTTEMPNESFYKLPEKKVLDAIIQTFELAESDIKNEDGIIKKRAGYFEAGTTFDKNGNKTPTLTGAEVNQFTDEARIYGLPETGSIQIHTHPTTHIKTNTKFISWIAEPSPIDILTHNNFDLSIIIGPDVTYNERQVVVPGSSTFETKIEPIERTNVVKFYSKGKNPIHTIAFGDLQKINSGDGKSESNIRIKYDKKKSNNISTNTSN
jgi:RHS repeat-associated protein